MSQQRILTIVEYHAYDERIVDAKRLLKCACPCNDCCGGKMRKIQVIYEHILRFGHTYSLHLHSMKDVEVPNINEEETNTDGDLGTLD